MKLEIDPMCFTRDFEEVDEKLPSIAQEIVLRGIEFQKIDEMGEESERVVNDILEILQESLECFHEMTEDDINNCMEQVLVSCELVCLVSEGLVEKRDGDKYRLTPKGLRVAKNKFA